MNKPAAREAMHLRHFEDFVLGERLALAPFSVTAGEIAKFAAEFGSLPVAFDAPTGDTRPAASNWHACAIFMAMISRGWLSETAFLGAPGVGKLRWQCPIRAGDSLLGFSEILALRASRSRPEMGFLQVRHIVTNAAGDTVLDLENPIIMTCRQATSAGEKAAAP